MLIYWRIHVFLLPYQHTLHCRGYKPPRPYKGTPDSERAAPNEVLNSLYRDEKTFVDIILR